MNTIYITFYNPFIARVLRPALAVFIFGFFLQLSFAQTFSLTKSASTTTPNVGATFNYTISYANPSITQNLINGVITDVVPPEVQFVPGSIAVSNPAQIASTNYNSATRTITITFVTPFPAGSTGNIQFSAGFPAGTYTGTQAVNTANGTTAGGNTSSNPVTVTAQNGITLPTFTDDVMGIKEGNDNATIGGGYLYQLFHGNKSASSAQNYIVTDILPAAFELTTITTGHWSGTSHPFSVYYQTNLNAVWTPLPGSPFNTSTVSSIDVSSLGLVPTEYVIRLQFNYGTLAGGGAFYPDRIGSSPPNLTGIIINPDHNGNPVVIGQVITNCMDVTAVINGVNESSNSCKSTTISSTPVMESYFGKTITNPQIGYVRGDIIHYSIYAGVPPVNTQDWVNPVIVDLLPPELEFTGNVTIANNGGVLSGPVFTQIDNYNNTGQTLLKWAFTGAFLQNIEYHEININFDVQVRQSATTGQYTNMVFQGGGTTFLACADYIAFNGVYDPITDIDDLDGDGNTTEDICSYSTPFNVVLPSAAGLESVKWVKGSLDADYSKYPAHGNTTPGGLADYLLKVSNPGTIPIKDIVVIDILPFVGDHGVLDPQTRLSEWRPFLVAPVAAPVGVTVYYSTEQNPCRVELGYSPAGCTGPVWSTSPPTDISTVQALKFDFGAIVLQPNAELELSWPMRAPVTAPTNGEIAWNSFGYIGTRNDNNVTLLSSEPIKVGIEVYPVEPAVYGDYVWYDTDRDGLQDAGETAGVDGVRVDLYSDVNGNMIAEPGGADGSPVTFTITANNGLYLFPNLDPGNYFAVFSNIPVGYVVTLPNVGVDDAIDSDGTPVGSTWVTAVTNLTTLEDDRSWDLGLHTPCINITNASVEQTFCEGDAGNNITVNTDQNAAGSIRFVRFATDQTVTNGSETAAELAAIYSGGTVLSTVTPTGGSSPYTATLTTAAAGWNMTAPGTYYVYAILNPDQGPDCRPLQEIRVNIVDSPTLSANDITVCESAAGAGATVDLNVLVQNPDLATLTFTESGNPVVQPLSVGTHMITVMGASGLPGCSATTTFTITVQAFPTAQIICAGQTYTLTAPAMTSNVIWYRNGLMVGSGPSYIVTQSGAYTYSADGSGGCATGQCCPVVFADGTCCSITSEGATPTCNDNSTETPVDDYFTLTTNPVGTGIGAQYNVTVVHNAVTTNYGPFTYGAASAAFGNFLISQGNALVTITDVTTGGCSYGPVTVTAPVSCWLCAGNLLVNPSFETGALNTSPPSGWSGDGQIAGNNMNEPHGTQYGLATFPGTNLYQDVPATSGSTFSLTFYSGAHNPSIQTVTLRYLDAGLSTLGTPAVHTVVYDTDVTTPQQLGGPYSLVLAAAPVGTAFVRVEANTNGVDFVKVDAFCLTGTMPICVLPVATLSQIAPTCTGGTANNNGKISLTAISNADKFGIMAGAMYSGTPDYAAATAIGTLPQDLQTSIPNTGGTYTIRFFNGADDCFKDTTVVVDQVCCPIGSSEQYDGCVGDGYSVVVNGVTYNETNQSGVETIVGGSYLGCDSIITVTLIYKPNSMGSEVYNGCQGDGYSVTVNGTVYNESNPTGTEVLTSANGCDSTVTISLVFKPKATNTINQTLCTGGSIVVNGTTYNEANPSGIETIAGGAANGCDSVITVNLSFNSFATSTVDYDGCQGDGYSVVVDGITYNETNQTGVETITGGSYLGCDSIITVILIYKPNSTGSEVYNGCQGDGYSVTVNGTVYNESNPSGTEVMTSANGCDSTVTITLLYKPNAIGSETYDGCQGDGYSVTVNGTVYNESNPSGTEVLTSANGCDSTLTIALNYKPNSTGSETYSGCQGDGYSVAVNGTVYNESNPSGTEIMTSANGCDSTVTINLDFSCVFDLALIKQLSNGQVTTVNPGDNVNYTITVFNQGNVPAYNIGVTDYLPADMVFNGGDNANWTDNGGLLTTTIAGPIAAGSSAQVTLVLQVSPSFAGALIDNSAEISVADDDNDDTNGTPTDLDSNPNQDDSDDTDGGDDVTDNSNGDEDDEDNAEINVATLSLGNLVWEDLNNDGIYDAGTESGISGVEVQLYDLGTDGIKSGDDNLLDTEMTGGNGEYLFDGLNEGTYYVKLTGVGVPAGYVSSTGDGIYDTDGNGSFEPFFGTNGDVNNTDDGTAMGAMIMSDTIVLTIFGEPTNDGDASNNTNLTVDFGLYQADTFDVALIKQLSGSQTTTVNPGDNVSYTITVYNQGTVPAYNIEVTDYLPTDMVFNAGDNANWTNNGGLLTTTVAGPIAAGSSAQVTLVLQVSPSFSGSVIDNSAEISIADDDTDDMNGTPTDLDSDPDQDDENDTDGGDDVTDNSNGDEDDEDNAVINVATLSLGNLVWEDLDNDGIFDAGTESGISGVEVQLYDLGTDGIKSGDDNLLDTEMTDGNGEYLFDGLNEGTYYVKLTGVGVPAGYVSSTGDGIYDTDGNGSFEPFFGTNGDVNNTDDGTAMGAMIMSDTIVLTIFGEPTNDGDASNNTNLTFDFGLYQADTFDVALIKQLSGGQATTVNPGDNVS